MNNFLDHSFFCKNRKKLVRALGQNDIAIIASNRSFPNLPHKFIQDKNLFYLTGIEQEGTILVLFPNGDEILFLQNSQLDPVWNGENITVDEVRQIAGIDKVSFYDKTLDFSNLIGNYDKVFTNFHDTLNMFYGKQVNLPNKKDINTIMRTLRLVKEPCEIECIKRACDITKRSFDALYEILKDGVRWEYEIEGELLGNFISYSSRYPSFTTIVASGLNACTLHYSKNTSQCKNGDLVLIDTGTEYYNYCSDITRVFPIGGKFAKRQKEIYKSVLNISNFAKSIVRVGMSFKELQLATVEKMKEELSRLGLLHSGKLNGDEYRKFFMHGVSHSLGLDVHDLCDIEIPFCEGMVVTIEPGIYVKEEGVGIRLEDDIVIRGNGCEVLSKGITLDPDEIEEKFKM